MQSEGRTLESDTGVGSTDTDSILDRSSTVFLVALVVRLIVAAVFLGSVDTVNSLSFMPVAASHGYFYLPYFPIVENILGSSALLMSHLHFLPIGLFPKLLPCIADSLISVWLLRYDRFDATFRRRAAWVYAFCPLTIILVCLEGQWDSLWILPMLAALALSIQTRDDSPFKYRACFLMGSAPRPRSDLEASRRHCRWTVDSKHSPSSITQVLDEGIDDHRHRGDPFDRHILRDVRKRRYRPSSQYRRCHQLWRLSRVHRLRPRPSFNLPFPFALALAFFGRR